jgi:hypothetical protein
MAAATSANDASPITIKSRSLAAFSWPRATDPKIKATRIPDCSDASDWRMTPAAPIVLATIDRSSGKSGQAGLAWK